MIGLWFLKSRLRRSSFKSSNLRIPPFFRKSDAVGKVQSHAFVGYYHAVICKNPQTLQADANGDWGTTVPLSEGLNQVYATVRDRA